MTADSGPRPYPTAQQDAEAAELFQETPQTLSPSYQLAFADPDFLLRDELRPVRLQLELLKPELAFQEQGIASTIVVFGSARIPDAEKARENLAIAEKEACAKPADPTAAKRLAVARKILEKSRYYEEARSFSRLMSASGSEAPNHDYVVITGGGGGIMEAANRGAADVGADSIGLNIVLPYEQAPNAYITPKLSFQFHYFAIRKMHFLMRARALAIFPGGFGTLDELFDALTLIQTGKIEPIPVLLFGEAYWRRVLNFEVMVEEGVISPEDMKIVRYVETAEEARTAILEFYDGAD